MPRSTRTGSARVTQARAMLENPGHDHLSVADIAHACGFSDVSTFYRAFRRSHAMSPADLRAEQER